MKEENFDLREEVTKKLDERKQEVDTYLANYKKSLDTDNLHTCMNIKKNLEESILKLRRVIDFAVNIKPKIDVTPYANFEEEYKKLNIKWNDLLK